MTMQKPPEWIKNDHHDRTFEDGEVLLVAVYVYSNYAGKSEWEIDRIRVRCDDDGASFLHDNDFDDPYDSWAWEDIEYYIQLSALGSAREAAGDGGDK